MKQIAPPMKMMEGICGEQKDRPGIPRRMSSLCVQVSLPEGILLYQTLTGAMFFLPTREATDEEREILFRNWFFVPEDFDERAFTEKVQALIRMMKKTGGAKTDFLILPTTDCNARCFYCYELGGPRIAMSEETALSTAEYLIRVSRGKPLQIRWFGGEPLYNRPAIDSICGLLNRRGAAFRSAMITNGFYLDRETIVHACTDWHLDQLQITLDGTEEIYNRTKAYIDADRAESPFYRVLDHIAAAAEAGIQVSVRLNMNTGNAEDLLRLADLLVERFTGKQNIRAYPALIKLFTGKKERAFETRQNLLDSYYALEEKLEAYGLLKEETLYRSIRIFRCMADNDSSEVILPDGRTGCCEQDSEEMITGSIYDERKDEAVIRRWKEPLSVPECGDCALLPLCTRLKKCEWNTDGCPEEERLISVRTLQKQMLRAYEEYKMEDTTS